MSFGTPTKGNVPQFIYEVEMTLKADNQISMSIHIGSNGVAEVDVDDAFQSVVDIASAAFSDDWENFTATKLFQEVSVVTPD